MVISSRTPEGDPNCCPVCGCRLRLEPSEPSRDAPCPQCGHLLWFARPTVSRQSETHSAILHLLEARFGLVPAEVRSAIQALAFGPKLKRVMERALTAKNLSEVIVGQ